MKLERNIKRIFIIFIYLLILALLAVLVYYAFLRPKPTCFDGKQNQNETGIDCGGVCQACVAEIKASDLLVREADFVPGGTEKFDVLAKISNPNSRYGSGEVFYRFDLKDTSGNVIVSREGKDFILPNETKYILETNLRTATQPGSASFQIKSVKWEEFAGYEEPNLTISNKRYDLISSGVGFAEVFGLLKNESPFDFGNIKVNVILRDSSGKPLAINSTELMTMGSQEQRDFRLLWPNSFPGTVEKVEIEPEANVFDSQNFIQKFFPSGRFQER